jgi:hypothetical protein
MNMNKGPYNRPHRTAISRRTLSLPMRELLDHGHLKGRLLDYGCGRGNDADTIGADKYDPHWAPAEPVGPYDTVTCLYVLNVLPRAAERREVVQRIRALLAPGGTGWIAVRNDLDIGKKTESRGPGSRSGTRLPIGKKTGGWTSRQTWQGHVTVPGGELVRTTAGYRLYMISGPGKEDR